MNPGSADYVVPFAVDLDGPVDVDALTAAVRDVISRHEPLRTVFRETDTGVVQTPSEPALDLNPLIVDEDGLEQAITALTSTGFDLTSAPPVRVQLLHCAGRWTVVVAAHHIVLDGMSLAPLTRDLLTAYRARRDGHAPDWAELPVRYGDYARWQRQIVADSSDLTYWQSALDGLPELLPLPTDRPRTTPATTAAHVPFTVDESVHRGISDLARRAGATPFMVVHSALAATLSVLSGTSDIAIGTPVSGRTDPMLDHLVGMFVGTVVLRTRVDPNRSFTDLLAAVRTADLAAYAHADQPFERVVDAVSPARSTTHHPLFQVLLAYQSGIDTELTFDNLTVRSRNLTSAVSRYDLEVQLRAHHSGLDGVISYPTELFDHTTITRWAALFQTVLTAAVTEPSTAIGDLDLLEPSERALVPAVGGDSAPEVMFPDLLVGSTGVAVCCGDTELTYRELDQRANRLARRLIALGLGPEDTVALLLPRSVDSVTAVWAVARSGAAPLPMDPAYPADRIIATLTAAGVRAVIAHDPQQVPAGITWVDVADSEGDSAPIADSERVRPLHVDHPAYVIYTSGSTGEPKGVVVTHRGLANHAVEARARYRVGPDSRILHTAAPSFDGAIHDILVAAVGDAVLVIPPPDVVGGDELTDVLRRERITHWTTTPAVPALGDPDGLDSLELLAVAGDVCPPELLARWGGDRTVLNLYGPTEFTIWVTASRALQSGDPITIGRPIRGASAMVLDGRLRPVPVGVIGELYLAGPALARGYLGAPALTAERFIANPHGYGRMYRTGDLVRWTADHDLDFVGRADSQIKIRGFRVELGEIDTVLGSAPGVDSAVTMLRDGILTSYVSGPADPATVLDFAAGRLPRYMVPTTVVVLDALPLTVNGKVDRAALPAPQLPPSTRPPRTPVEHLVADAVAEILGVTDVGADADFFALGGNSLSATRVVSRLAAVSGLRIGVRDLFDRPTVAALAALIEQGGDQRPPLVAEHNDQPAPLAYAQQRLWLLNRVDPESPAYNVAFAVEFDGNLDALALTAALTDVIERHAVLRTVFPDTESGPVQQVLPASVEFVVGDDLAVRGFDLTTEAPLRLALSEEAPGRHTLTVVLHHIAVDGLSFGPLIRDFAIAYEARTSGHAPDWTPLPIHYTDFARWQRRVLGDAADPRSRMRRELDYWTSALDGLPALLPLPTDRPRPGTDRLTARQVPFRVPAELQGELESIARQQNSTPFMLLHAALAVLLSKLTGAQDLAIGTPTSGRTDPALDDVVGMFVGTVALRSRIDPRAGFDELLASVRETDLAAFAHAEVPFELVVDAVAPARSTGHHPLFQVMLAYDNFDSVPDVTLSGMNVRGREVGTGTSRFDLEISVREQDGGLDGVFVYPAELFDAATVEAWAGRLLRVLRAVVADVHVPVGAIDVLSESERAAHVAGVIPAASSSAVSSLAELFEQRAVEQPDAAAVTFGDITLTYRELERRSAEVAAHLQASGVAAEDLVAIVLPRSIDLIVAILAVTRAGAAYVPIDVDYPAERIRYLLDDAKPALVLSALPAVSTSPPRSVNKYSRVGSAYVIYTSGSTGEPKGVLVTHANVLSLLANTRDEFGFGPGDVWTMFHSHAFDFSVWEMWGALTTGGRLVLVDHYLARSPREFADLLVDEGVTVLNQTPSAFGQLAEHLDSSSLRLLIFGGEALDPAPVATWLTHHPNVRAVNMFGITETTVHVTRHDLRPGETRRSIGRALPGLRTYVLDASLQPVPTGTAGELYVSGPQVAAGYLGRPALTAQRFVADPFVPGARMYRTGDLARYSRDGDLDHIGRADTQVALHGYRIEPGEIEATLLRRPDVERAAVMVRGTSAIGDRLVAYVVSTAGPRELSAYLRTMLPEYLVPNVVVPVEAFTLTANGKLDRDALPEPAVVVHDVHA
ncbi:MAG: amino acid adenylation domain-containing protein, partial [Rhodococcus sp. (in: high G+C Gram-positive bacteria)]